MTNMGEENERLSAEHAAMALALRHYKGWFGDDCMCDDECPIFDGLEIAGY